MMDTYGKKAARQEISMIEVVVPNMMMNVLDRAIQCLASAGMSDDTPVARIWREGRSLRIADGPDGVHKMVVARRELKRFAWGPVAEARRRQSERKRMGSVAASSHV
jgi:acyl-CoA dehydrogenase